MLPLTVAQHYRKWLFHLAVEVVVLNAVQGDVQTHACPIIVCSNRQPVTRSWPVYEDLELVPRRNDKNIAAFAFHDFTVLHCTVIYVKIELVLSGQFLPVLQLFYNVKNIYISVC